MEGSSRIYHHSRLVGEYDKEPKPSTKSTPQTQDSAEIEAGRPVLDYRENTADPDRVASELPPAWDVSPSPWTVGYEPIGETSIGVEQERRKSSRWAKFRVPATKLALHHEGRHPSDGEQSTRLAELDKKRITQGFCSKLDIPEHLQAEAVRAMLMLDLTTFGNRKRIECIALAVIELIVDYERRYRRRNPNASRLGEEPEVKYLAREVGLIPGKMQLSRKVKQQLLDLEFFEPGAPGLRRCRSVYFTRREDPETGEPRWVLSPQSVPIRTSGVTQADHGGDAQ